MLDTHKMNTVINLQIRPSIMKVFSLILFILLFKMQAFACELNSKYNYISLSGPVSMLMEFMGLSKDPSLKGISVFHPMKGFGGEKLGGGIFLSAKTFKKHKNNHVFYDESKELKKSLNTVHFKFKK
jgi:hypothetical protein